MLQAMQKRFDGWSEVCDPPPQGGERLVGCEKLTANQGHPLAGMVTPVPTQPLNVVGTPCPRWSPASDHRRRQHNEQAAQRIA